ncbi:hypothetical protein ABTX85_16555 [Streptomyces sp. NPDC096097]|uniref:hypothetical protein n=1 Tax=Streptomyces sp. NPDC096097 TaxID=3155546 RepID=UPI00331754FD
MDVTTALDRVLRHALVVRVGSVGGFGVDGEIRVDLADPAESATLRTAMAVNELPGGHCMCGGDVRFEFYDGDDGDAVRLAVVVLHHGAALRWDQWEGDAVLTDGNLLLEWLDGHGMPGPLHEFEAARQQATREAARQRAWVAAVPAGLEGAVDRILDLSWSGRTASPELLEELTDRLRLTLPDPVEQVLALLAWYGSGSGRCSGQPLHEDVPGQLLGRVPMADLIAALADARAGARHDDGAVRHLVGHKTRPRQKRDVARLPDQLRARLLTHARGSWDSDKRARAERRLAPPRA